MSNPYTTQTIANYNTSPPPDDGTEVAANQLSWAKHKEKLGDPVKTLAEDMNTELLAAFADYLGAAQDAVSTTSSLTAANERRLALCTNTITVTLLAAVTAGTGFLQPIKNGGSGVVTVDASGSETIDGDLTLVLNPNDVVILFCDGSNWQVLTRWSDKLVLRDGSELTISAGSVTPTENYHTVDTEADASTDDLTDIVTTNIPDGGLLLIRANTAARTVVVKHTASGANKVVTADQADLTLNDAVKSVTLQRRGDHWEEVSRSAPSSGARIGLQRFTASGTYTPTAGTASVEVKVKGPGGNGGAATLRVAAAGGGEGGLAVKYITSGLGATETVTVGTPGNPSSFGTHCTGNTGGNGTAGTIDADGGTGGAGGTATGGDLNHTGQGGSSGVGDPAAGGDTNGGQGGGQGGGRGVVNTSNGQAGNLGGGGSGAARGASAGTSTGGAGGDGYVIVREYS